MSSPLTHLYGWGFLAFSLFLMSVLATVKDNPYNTWGHWIILPLGLALTHTYTHTGHPGQVRAEILRDSFKQQRCQRHLRCLYLSQPNINGDSLLALTQMTILVVD